MRVWNPFSGWDRGDGLFFVGLSMIGVGCYFTFGLGPAILVPGAVVFMLGVLAVLYKPTER